MTRWRTGGMLAACALAVQGAAALWTAPPVAAQAASPVVYVVAIEGTIDLGLAPFLARALREAGEAGAAAVVLDINTFGGRVDAAVAMRDALLRSPVRTIAFVNQRAISAGALIALACNTVVMVEGGTIGAAAPVVGGATGESQPADEKSVSYVRTEFRATAEARNRPPLIAEAMVDADVDIEGVIASGKLLTLTTSQALDLGVADLTAETVALALEAAGVSNATVQRVGQSWAEGLVRFLTNPVVSSLLMTVGLLGILVEIRTPGFAVPGTVGLLALGLFFWGHWLVQLAGWEELLLIGGGFVLLMLEVFLIPGTTVAGLAGVLAVVAGLGMTLVGEGATLAVLVSALGRVAISVLLALAGALALMRLLPHLPFGRQLVLDTGMAAGLGWVSAPEHDKQWLGRSGTTLSPLRPAGIADIDGARVDVVSEGGFIEAGTPVEVIRVDGNRVVVHRAALHQEDNHA
ncbi:MAG: nodulation protein NfeD [Vicinamibacterales bacterium]